MILVSSSSCLCPIHWSLVLSREWRYSWSSADRRCSNYIWVIMNLITYQGASYIRGLMVPPSEHMMQKLHHYVETTLFWRKNDITVQCRYIVVNYLTNINKRHLIAHPLGYGVCFVNQAYGWYFALIPTNIYAISYNIEPRYIGTRLYYVMCPLWVSFQHKKLWKIQLYLYVSSNNLSYEGLSSHCWYPVYWCSDDGNQGISCDGIHQN